ncbi:MAG: hypothetical protein K0Q72_4759, partial [Armatimonadetes bacterium]|nr:hypothetical protein [Armatimonadota bacterium]
EYRAATEAGVRKVRAILDGGEL